MESNFPTRRVAAKLPDRVQGELRARAHQLAREASADLARLRRIRGAGRRTARRIAGARLRLALAAALLGVPLTRAAEALTPSFVSPFLVPAVGFLASPTFADLDGDGDLDAFVGESDGNTIFFANTGTASAPAFAPPADQPLRPRRRGIPLVPGLRRPRRRRRPRRLRRRDTTATRSSSRTPGRRAPRPSPRPPPTPSASPTWAFQRLPDLRRPRRRRRPRRLRRGALRQHDLLREHRDGERPGLRPARRQPLRPRRTWHTTRPRPSPTSTATATSTPSSARTTATRSSSRTRARRAPRPSPRRVTNPFGLADVGLDASPTFADLDGDGDLDAFVGETYGSTVFFANTGTASAPAFAPPPANPFGLADVGYNASPTFADLDGDGDLDAFVGERRRQHDSSSRTPGRRAPRPSPPPATNPFGLADVGSRGVPGLRRPRRRRRPRRLRGRDLRQHALLREHRDGERPGLRRARAPTPSASPTWAYHAPRPSPTSTATATSTPSSGSTTATRSSSRTPGRRAPRPSPRRHQPLRPRRRGLNAPRPSPTSTATATSTPSSASASAARSSSRTPGRRAPRPSPRPPPTPSASPTWRIQPPRPSPTSTATATSTP